MIFLSIIDLELHRVNISIKRHNTLHMKSRIYFVKKSTPWLLAGLFLLLNAPKGHTQETKHVFQGRTYFTLAIKPIKKLTIDVIPEIRFDEQFSISKYLIETELTYKPIKILHLLGAYRFTINPREKKDTEYLHRYGFGLKLRNSFGRWKPALRITYTNYADDPTDKKREDHFLRYKASVKYNIKKSKITPGLGLQLFHQLPDFIAYKLRANAGLDIKLFKKNYIAVIYKADIFLQEDIYKHIVCLGYELKL